MIANTKYLQVLAVMVALSFPGNDVAAEDITIEVSGEVADECAVDSAPGSIDLGELSSIGITNIPVTIRCNAPFTYSMQSRNGGLAYLDGEAVNGFSDFVDYNLSSSIPTDTGVIADTCTSAQIKTGADSCIFTNSGIGVALPSNAMFTLAWTPPSDPLLAGAYEDQLTLTFAVQP